MEDISIPCGACKHLKRKCTNRCIFAPYFGKKQNEASFAAVHKVFGAGNVSKHLSTIPTNHRKKAMETITYEAQARISDPINGCVSTICALKKQVKALQAEVSMMKAQQQMNNGFAYVNALQTTDLQHQQMLQQPNFNVSVQPAYANNPSPSIEDLMNMNNFNPVLAATNNLMNMNNFNPGFDTTKETASSSQSFQPFQNSRFSYHQGDN